MADFPLGIPLKADYFMLFPCANPLINPFFWDVLQSSQFEEKDGTTGTMFTIFRVHKGSWDVLGGIRFSNPPEPTISDQTINDRLVETAMMLWNGTVQHKRLAGTRRNCFSIHCLDVQFGHIGPKVDR